MQSIGEEVKKLLTAKTAEALAEGSFGLPWYAGEYLNSIYRGNNPISRSYKCQRRKAVLLGI